MSDQHEMDNERDANEASAGLNPWERRDLEDRQRREQHEQEVRRKREENRRQQAEERRRQLKANIEQDQARGGRPQQVHLEGDDEYKARLAAWYATPAGVEGMAREQALVASAKQAKVRNQWRDLIENSGAPLQIANLLRSEHLRATDATAEVKRGTWNILVLAGKVGVGKTVAAAAWLLEGHIPLPGPDTPENTWRDRDWQYFTRGKDARDVFQWLKPYPLWVSASRLARWERYDNKAMDRLLKAPKLVIDDLYAEFADAKGNFQTILDEVVAERLASERPILITTNAAIDAFKARYGERIADRIREHGRFVSFAGESLRRRAP